MNELIPRPVAPVSDRTPRVPPRIACVVARDGHPLAASIFEPPGGASRSRVVVINSATGVRRSYYAAFATYLAAHGFTVVTYDYRGIGGSRPARLRGFRARMRHWGELDFAAVLDWVERDLGCAAPLVVGHSVGGQIVGLAANNERIAALLLVGAQSGDWRLWPAAARVRLLLMWHAVIPALTTALGYLPGQVFGGEDLPAGVAREWARWGRRRGYLAGGTDASRRAGFARLRVPLLAYGFDDDSFAPRAAVDALLALSAGAATSRRFLAPSAIGARSVGHFGFFRPPFEGSLWSEARQWLETHAPIVRVKEAS
jgi:predicted alpha/beta hydrolase